MKMFIMLILSLIVFIYAAFKQASANELEYSTEQVREIWQACSQNFQVVMPQIPQRIRWPLCDCYTDYLRKTLTSLKVKTLTKEESKAIGLKVAKICEIPKELLNKPQIKQPLLDEST